MSTPRFTAADLRTLEGALKIGSLGKGSPDGSVAKVHRALLQAAEDAERIETLRQERDALRAAIMPDAEKRARSFWTTANLATLASAHRSDSETIDETGHDTDADYDHASLVRQQRIETLETTNAALTSIIRWALGEDDDGDTFPGLPDDWPKRKFYWREPLCAQFNALLPPVTREGEP